MRTTSTPRTWSHRLPRALAAGSLVASTLVGSPQIPTIGPKIDGLGQLFCEIFDFLDCD